METPHPEIDSFFFFLSFFFLVAKRVYFNEEIEIPSLTQHLQLLIPGARVPCFPHSSSLAKRWLLSAASLHRREVPWPGSVFGCRESITPSSNDCLLSWKVCFPSVSFRFSSLARIVGPNAKVQLKLVGTA